MVVSLYFADHDTQITAEPYVHNVAEASDSVAITQSQVGERLLLSFVALPQRHSYHPSEA